MAAKKKVTTHDSIMESHPKPAGMSIANWADLTTLLWGKANRNITAEGERVLKIAESEYRTLVSIDPDCNPSA